MFSRILNSIRESIKSNRFVNKYGDEYAVDSRGPSSDKLDQHILSRFSSVPIGIIEHSQSFTKPMPIGFVTSTVTESSLDKRGSLFGISDVAYDDYVQKDLISSSWS